LDADRGCDSAVTATVRLAWKRLHEYLPILTRKEFSLKLKGKVCRTGSHCTRWSRIACYSRPSGTVTGTRTKYMYFVADTGVNCLYLVNTNIFLNMNSPFDILFGTEVNIKQIFGTALVPRTYSR